jgi:hypothetical protein
VAVGAEEPEIGFSVFPTVNERDGMIDLPAEADSQAAIRAALICACDHSLFDARRDWGVIGFALPLFGTSCHRLFSNFACFGSAQNRWPICNSSGRNRHHC